MAQCKHNWDLLDKTVLPSGWEQLENQSKNFQTPDFIRMFQKKLVYIFKCAHCGDIRKEVESCPS